MPTRLRAISILFPVALVAAGCGDFDRSRFADGRAGLATPRSFINKSYEEVDIIAALTDGKTQTAINDKTTDVEASKALQAAYAKFYEQSAINRNGPERRNQIQDELFRASDQRCNYYKAYLYHLQSTQRSFFGGLSTALGGLGAIFTSASTARALSGAAGITSGVGAEAMEAQFASLTIQVLIEGIEKQRKDVFEAARSQRFRSDSLTNSQRLATLSEYTVEHAILDAVRYHGACTITEGLRAAANSIQTIRHPGPEMMQYAIAQSMMLRDQLSGSSPRDTWSLGYGGLGGGSGGGGTAAGLSNADGIDIVPNTTSEIRIVAITRRATGFAASASKLIDDAKFPDDTKFTADPSKTSYAIDAAKKAFDDLKTSMPNKLQPILDGIALDTDAAKTKKTAAWYATKLQALNVDVLKATDEASRRVAVAAFRLEFEKYQLEIGNKFFEQEKLVDAALDGLEKSLAAATKAHAEKDPPVLSAEIAKMLGIAEKYPAPVKGAAVAAPVAAVDRAQALPPPR